MEFGPCFLPQGLMRSDDLSKKNWSEFRGDVRTFAKHHAIDRHVLRHHFLTFFVVFSFLCPCLEAHLGMRACMQCTCKHDSLITDIFVIICPNFQGDCRM